MSQRRSGAEGVSQTQGRHGDAIHVKSLPDELLVQILSHLDPKTLQNAGLTCSRFRRVVTDDGCWREAFVRLFQGIPYRRVAAGSWRKEFTQRLNMIRAWRSGRVTTLHFDPRFGPIDRVYLDEHARLPAATANSNGSPTVLPPHRLLCASLRRGVVLGADARTGKLDKHPITWTGDEAGGVWGVQGVGEVGGMRVDRHRIAMTPPSGHLTLITSFTSDTPTSRRIATVRARMPPQHQDPHPPAVHATPSRCITWNPTLLNCVATGGDDGRVAIWDVAPRPPGAGEGEDPVVRGRLLAILRTGMGPPDTGIPGFARRLPGGPGLRALALDPKMGLVVAGLDDGDACVWEVDMQRLVADGASNSPTSLLFDAPAMSPARFARRTRGADGRSGGPVIAVHYDPGSACFVVVTERSMEMFSAVSGELVATFSGAHGLGDVAAETGNGVTSTGTAATLQDCIITATAWERDRDGAEGVAGEEWRGASVLVSGDSQGTVCTWEIRDDRIPQLASPKGSTSSLGSASSGGPEVVEPSHGAGIRHVPLRPMRTVTTTRGCAITCVKIDPAKFVVGCADSQVHVFDVLSGRLLKSMAAFRNPARGLNGAHAAALAVNANGAIDSGVVGVRCMWITDRIIVVGTSAGIVKTWTATAIEDRLREPVKAVKRSAKNSKRVGGTIAASPKHQARHDMRAELREHYETADRARAYDMFHDRQSSKINGVTSTEGWTDEELVGYAMIMSLEETGLPPPTPPDQAGCWEEASLAAAKSKGKARTPSSLSARGSVSSFSPKIGPSGGVSVSPRMAPTSPMFQPASRSSPKLDAAMSSSPRGTREQWAMLGAAALSSSPGGSASSFNKSNSKVSFTTVQEQQQLQKMSETSQYRKLMSADSWEDDTEDDSDPDFEVDHSVRAKGQRGKKNKKKASTSSLQLDDEDEELQFALQLSLRDM